MCHTEYRRQASEAPVSLGKYYRLYLSISFDANHFAPKSGDESGWDENSNIFQSGAESSSPARPSPVRPRVSRTVPKKSRKSMSAPPQMEESSSPIRLPKPFYVSPPQSPFKPMIPPFPELKLPPPSRVIPEFHPIEPTKQEEPDVSVHIEETIPEETEPPSQETPDLEDYQEEVDTDSPPDTTALVKQDPSAGELVSVSVTSRSSAGQISARILVWLVILVSSYATWIYKIESASIGFCDQESHSNQALEAILERRATAVACDAERQRQALMRASQDNSSSEGTVPFDESCPLPPLIPLPEPASCTPCPNHATCTQHGVLCDTGYLLKPHILLSFIPVSPSQSALTTKYVPQISEGFFNAVSTATSGLPLFGSIGFPPRCVEDPKRKRHIGILGKAIEARLAKERGRRICRGDHVDPSEVEDSTEQAVKWGVEVEKLREDLRKTVNVSCLTIWSFPISISFLAACMASYIRRSVHRSNSTTDTMGWCVCWRDP